MGSFLPKPTDKPSLHKRSFILLDLRSVTPDGENGRGWAEEITGPGLEKLPWSCWRITPLSLDGVMELDLQVSVHTAVPGALGVQGSHGLFLWLLPALQAP